MQLALKSYITEWKQKSNSELLNPIAVPEVGLDQDPSNKVDMGVASEEEDQNSEGGTPKVAVPEIVPPQPPDLCIPKVISLDSLGAGNSLPNEDKECSQSSQQVAVVQISAGVLSSIKVSLCQLDTWGQVPFEGEGNVMTIIIMGCTDLGDLGEGVEEGDVLTMEDESAVKKTRENEGGEPLYEYEYGIGSSYGLGLSIRQLGRLGQ